MANWQPIQPQHHQAMMWRAYQDYAFAQQDNGVLVSLAELPYLIAHYPIVFTHDASLNNFQLKALIGLGTGNLFLNPQSKWTVPYVPALYRSHPFCLLKDQNDQHVVCVDHDSPCFLTQQQDDANPFFDEHNRPSPQLEPIIQFLQQQLDEQNRTQLGINLLAEYELFKPWDLDIQLKADVPRQKLVGLYTIDQQKLISLDADQYQKLMQTKAMDIIYAHLMSQHRFNDLNQRLNQQLAMQKESFDLDKFFNGEQDTLAF